MNYLVDTSIWSLALRQNSISGAEVLTLKSLIADGRVEIIGAIRQEVLSGIRNPEQFVRLRDIYERFLTFN
jgi:predicted nucleic acid-binding protein